MIATVIYSRLQKGEHIVGEQEGFVHNALTIQKSGTNDGDHQNQLDKNNYVKWHKDKLLPNSSLLVFGNI